MSQHTPVFAYFSKRNLTLSAVSLSLGIGVYHVVSDSNQATDSGPLPTKEIEVAERNVTHSPIDPAVITSTPEALNHTHSSTCGCAAHSKEKETETKVTSVAVPLPKALRNKLLNHSKGQKISFTLPDGGLASGVVEITQASEGRTIALSGSLTTPQEGNFYFNEEAMPGVAGEFSGAVYFKNTDTAYSVETNKDGTLELRETHADNILCRNYAPLPIEQIEAEEGPQEIAADHPTDILIPTYQNGVIPLSSLPTATAVVYLDFDGELGPHLSWGDFDAAHSGANNTQVKEVWERVAEDFAPFNINVTTDLQMYLDAPANSRIQCIITPTTTAAPSAGGVAFGGDFNRSLDRPCWAFGTTGKYAAEVISHEIGHTLNLAHDGRSTPSEIYYGGHGSGDVGWASIMGVGYYKNLSQWSKGEYLNANQTQDDLSTFTNNNNNVSYRTDDHGANLATATYLEVHSDTTVDSEGIIETSSDVDSFKFTVTSDNSWVRLDIDPVAKGPNLDIYVELADSSGTVISSNNPDTALDASITERVAAGEYTISVTGVGRGSATGDGYTDYASLGEYTVTGTIDNGLAPDRFTIAENPANGANVGTVTANNSHGGATLSYSIASGNDSGAFAIDSNGVLTVADPTKFDFEALSSYFDDPATFDLSVTITNPTTPSLTESVRAVVTITDVNEAPIITAISTLNILEHTAVGTVLLTATQVDTDQYDQTPTWSITSGNTGGAFALDSATGVLTIATPLNVAIPSYTLVITSTDSGSPALSDSETVSINVIDIVEGYIPGSITQSFYENISGVTVADLTSSSSFPNDPDSLSQLTSINVGSHGDSYGSVIRGYVIPPTTGSYTFWVAGDDRADMRLSSNASPANAAVIATLTGAVGSNDWTGQPNQQSAPVTLTAGQPYYLEIRHKEGTGGDHISAAWQGPGITQEVIPGRFLAPYEFNYTPHITSSTISIQDDIYNSHSVTLLPVSDLNSTDTHSGFTITSGNDDGVFAINSTSGAITIADNTSIIAGNSYTLGIELSDSGAPTLTGSGTVTVNVVTENSLILGSIEQQIFSDISGSSVANLTGSANYPNSPSSTRTLTSFDSGQNIGESYGSRIRAYIVPPTTGSYNLYVSSDDSSQLYLSSDETEGNKTQIASVSGAIAYGNWTGNVSQKSSPIALTAGQKYYIETLHKEGGGGDHVQVAWEGPGFATPTVIAGTYIERVNLDSAPVWDAAPYAFSTNNTNANGTVVGTVSATDASPDTLAYSIISGNGSGKFAINPITGVISIADHFALPLGANVLSVGVQDAASVYNETLTNVTITVTGNNAPVVDATSFDLVENSGTATAVGTVTFTDPDAETWVYSIDSGNQAGYFIIDPSTGAITTTASASIDFEEENTYSLVVRVTDSSSFYGIATITVNVTDVAADDSDADGLDDAWELANFGNTSSQSAGSDADGDGITNLAEIAAGTSANNADSDLDGFSDGFEIDQGTDPLSNGSVPTTLLAAFWDFDDNTTAKAYDRIRAVSGVLTSGAVYTSDQGGRSGSAGDRAMDFGAGTTQLVDVTNMAFLNNAASDDILTISFWQKLDSVKNSSAFYAFSPTGTSNNRGIQTHCPWSDNNIYLDMGGTGTGQRSTANASSVTWTNWNHVTLVKNGSTSKIWVNGSLFRTETGMNALKTDMTRLLIGGSEDSNQSINGVIDDFAIFDSALTPGQIAQLTSGSTPTSITANQLPVVNDATFAVVENSANATAVGTVVATDPGDTLSYAITAGNTGNAFAIDNSGNITVDQVVDFELNPSNAYTLTVRVTDLTGDTDTATITVNVSNVNDAPTAADASVNIAENASVGTAVTTVVVSDQDTGNTFSYAITSGNGDAAFAIAANGAITTLKALDFETTQQYQLAVEVTDQGGLTGSATITVNVTNVVEGTNLALGTNHATAAGSVATQSSTGASAPASRAVDGNTDGLFANGSVTHTDGGAAPGAVWWQVDLGQDRAMHSIILFNRDSIQTRLSNFKVSILDASSSVVTSKNFYEGSGNAGASETWALPSAVTGRVVRVELIGGLNNDGNNILSLAEVQVLAGGIASQSTTASGGVASRAIDNNTNGLWTSNSVTHTDSSSANWWEVQLDQFSVIEQLNLYNRTDAGTESRLSNFRVTLWQGATQVYSSNHFTQGGTYAGASYFITDLNGTVADRVRIESLGTNSAGNRVISLAEVQVFGEVLATANTDTDGDKLKDSWELSYYGHLGATSDTADTDDDGYNSFKEMAFGMNPTTNSKLSDHMTSSIIDDAGTEKLELKFRRPTNHVALGLVYQLKSSTNLTTWVNDGTVSTATTADVDGITEWVSYRFDPSAAAKKFIQMEATPAP